MPDVSAIVAWLVDGAPDCATPQALVVELFARMNGAGVPIDRYEGFVRTLHPLLVGRSFIWTPDGLVAQEHTHAYLETAFLATPAAEVVRTGAPLRQRLDDGAPRGGLLGELATGGFTDYYASVKRFVRGHEQVVTVATRRAGGFSDDDLAAIESVLRPFARLTEIYAQARNAVHLLNTYVGHDAGERILSGHIRRGDVESIHAAIWFSDLRGYTTLSERLPPAAVVAALNDLFECQELAIDRHGGEILKLMGDGLLAIFRVGDEGEGEVCDRAVAAVREAYAALDARNRSSDRPLELGLALHIGDVLYGNIGGSTRLDFTCVGPAVNLASRLEGLSHRQAGVPVVVSSEFARATSAPTTTIGTFELKGVAHPVVVHALCGFSSPAEPAVRG
jgi:adenylate cyclase